MKRKIHTKEASTIFFDGEEELNKYKQDLIKQGFIKFNPDDF